MANKQAKLKVWTIYVGNREKLIAATSARSAAQALDCSVGHLRKYGSITANIEAIAAAMAEPGKAIDSPHQY